MQYVMVKFQSWQRVTYTYHNAGAPVAVGDKLQVMTDRGEATVIVAGITDIPPGFATKPILGKLPAATTE
jgi:hypothetical protein